jgi:hypothetical protein
MTRRTSPRVRDPFEATLPVKLQLNSMTCPSERLLEEIRKLSQRHSLLTGWPRRSIGVLVHLASSVSSVLLPVGGGSTEILVHLAPSVPFVLLPIVQLLLYWPQRLRLPMLMVTCSVWSFGDILLRPSEVVDGRVRVGIDSRWPVVLIVCLASGWRSSFRVSGIGSGIPGCRTVSSSATKRVSGKWGAVIVTVCHVSISTHTKPLSAKN